MCIYIYVYIHIYIYIYTYAYIYIIADVVDDRLLGKEKGGPSKDGCK